MSEYEQYKIRTPNKSNLSSYLFDRLTGIFFRSKRIDIKNPKKILLIRNDHIGDMAFCTSVFREIKKVYPSAKITVLADKNNRVLIEKDPHVGQIIVGDRFWSQRTLKSFFNYLKTLKQIKNEKFDIGIDLRRSRMNIFFYLYLPKVKARISYYNINGGKAFLTHPILYEKKINFVRENIELLNKALDLKIKNFHPEVITDEEDKQEVEKYLKENNLKNFIVVCPGATTEIKKWPSERFKEFMRIFNIKYPLYKIIVASGPSDSALIKELCGNNPSFIPLIGFNLRKICIILKKALAVVANDGGIRELAWMSGGKVVSLSGPLDLDIHAPLGNSKVIHHKLPCYPCDNPEKCPKPHGQWCMELITPEEVLASVEDFIKESK
jgi:heptosyltransferase II